jgi:hypothetical protein
MPSVRVRFLCSRGKDGPRTSPIVVLHASPLSASRWGRRSQSRDEPLNVLEYSPRRCDLGQLEYLPKTKSFAGVRPLFESSKRAGWQTALIGDIDVPQGCVGFVNREKIHSAFE